VNSDKRQKLFDRIRKADVGGARRTDPSTAHAAADATAAQRGDQRVKVFVYLLARGVGGATDYEVGAALGILRTSAGKRRKELCDMNLVEKSGDRRHTDTRSTAIVWRVTELALAEASAARADAEGAA
jgi:hypothetical protein